MMKKPNRLAALLLLASSAAASTESNDPTSGTMAMGSMMRPDRAPASVNFADMYSMGRWMLSYRYMRMDMDGNLKGSDDIDSDTVVTRIPNRFARLPQQPPTLRVVPLDMSTDMHMFGVMYMPSAKLNFMFMAPYVEKEMSHLTYAGPSGTRRLDTFKTSSDGLGDVKAAILMRLYEQAGHHVHLTGGLSFPTGSIVETATILTPRNTTPRVRMPYPMQLGSGTYDVMPGITYKATRDRWSLGTQYLATIRIDENDENYTLGDHHRVSLWGSYVWAPWLSTSLQLAVEKRGKIDGLDRHIVGPVQTADPDRQGGERINVGFGVNFLGRSPYLRGHRLRCEFMLPVYNRLNGPQLEMDSSVVVRYQYMFAN